jgi:multiple sugar transport system ATP-binding protein
MSGATMLVLDALNKHFRRKGGTPVHAVKDLSLAIGKGEIVALLGSSGCGKTSTLRMIAGLESVTRGTISLNGRRIDRLAPSQRKVAMAFEGYSLYPPLTVRDNIAFALKAQKLDSTEARKRVAAIAKLIEIEPILDRYPSSISGGQQQRASLARALVRQADLYLLDEPMGQLEPQLRAVLRGRVKSLLNDSMMTAIFVTHDQTEANALADRIAVMEGGVLQQFGTPKDLKDRPANLFVATFIGEPPMNVFDASVTHAGEALRFALDNGPALDLPASDISEPVRVTLGARQRVTLGIRPHKLLIGEGPIAARVASNQWLGDQSHIATEIAGKLAVAVTHKRVAAQPGETVALGLSARDLHLFDIDSGVALAHGPEAA